MEIQRDWGWAPEYVEAMWLMLQQDKPDDYIIGTGETHSLQEFVAEAFNCVGLDWRKYVIVDERLFCPTDIMVGKSNPKKAKEVLGWQTKYKMKDVVRKMAGGVHPIAYSLSQEVTLFSFLIRDADLLRAMADRNSQKCWWLSYCERSVSGFAS